MSSTHYSKLDNLYTKTEIDTLIENSSSSDPGVITKEQSANIANGSFDGLPIGFYWTINGINFRIMAHDQFYGYNEIDTHHVVVMPDTILAKHAFSGYSNQGAYIGSLIKTYIDGPYNLLITSMFGANHILSHTHDLTSGSYNNGTLYPAANTKEWIINTYNVAGYKPDYATYYNWQDADMIRFPAFENNGGQLILAKYNGSNYGWWVSTSYSKDSTHTYYISDDGRVTYTSMANPYGDRPAFLVY